MTEYDTLGGDELCKVLCFSRATVELFSWAERRGPTYGSGAAAAGRLVPENTVNVRGDLMWYAAGIGREAL
jgi:hypothetical protein